MAFTLLLADALCVDFEALCVKVVSRVKRSVVDRVSKVGLCYVYRKFINWNELAEYMYIYIGLIRWKKDRACTTLPSTANRVALIMRYLKCAIIGFSFFSLCFHFVAGMESIEPSTRACDIGCVAISLRNDEVHDCNSESDGRENNGTSGFLYRNAIHRYPDRRVNF